MGTPLRVLLIEDSEDDALLLRNELQRGGFTPFVTRVDNETGLSEALDSQAWDVILADFVVPGLEGTRSIQMVKATGLDIPFIVVSGRIGEETAVEAMRGGAHDFVKKNNLARLCPVIERELRAKVQRAERRQAREALLNTYQELEVRVQQRTAELEAANAQLRREIEERRRTEVALRIAEQQMELAVAGSNGCLWEITFDPRNPWELPEKANISPRQKALIGFEDTEFPDSLAAWRSRIHSEDLHHVVTVVENTIREKSASQDLEYRIRHKDGSWRWLHLRGHIVRDKDGVPQKWVRVIWDTTEQKRGQMAQRRSEQRAALAISASNGIIWDVPLDPRSPFEDNAPITPALKALLGFKDHELPDSGLVWLERIHPEDEPQRRIALERLFSGEANEYDTEFRVLHRDGTYRWINVRGALFRDELDRPVQFTRLLWDVTAKRTVEERLRETETRFRLALDHSPVTAFAQDRNLRFTWIYNSHLFSDPQEVIGKTDEEIFDQDSTQRVIELKRQALRGPVVANGVELVTKSGTSAIYNLSLEPAYDASNAVVGIYGAAVDVTSHIQFQQQLADAKRRLELAVSGTNGDIWEAPVAARADIPDAIEISQFQKELIGFAADEFSNSYAAWEERIHADDLPVQQSTVADFLSGKTDYYDSQYRVRHKDGHYVWVHVKGYLDRDKNGCPIRWTRVLWDITSQKQAEERLLNTARRLELAVSSMRGGITEFEFKIDPSTGDIVDQMFIDPNLKKVLGYADHELQNTRSAWIARIHPEDTSTISESLKGMFEDPDCNHCECQYRMKHANGAWRWMQVRGIAVRNERKELLRWLGLIWDITEQKEADEDLRNHQERLNLAISALNGGYWEAHVRLNKKDESILFEDVFYDDSVRKMIGASASDFPNAPEATMSIVHPDDMALLMQAHRDYFFGRTDKYDVDYRVRHRDGHYIWVTSRGVLIPDSNGDTARWVGVTWDITEQKEFSERLRESEETARQQLAEIEYIYRYSGIGLCVVDRNYRWLRINEKLAEINGFPIEAHINRRLRDLVPKFAAEVEKPIQRVFDTGKPLWNVELSSETPAQPGLVRTWIEHFLPIKDASGNVTAVNIVCDEVTERKDAELQLRLVSERFRVALKDSSTSVFSHDNDLRYTWIYNQAVELTEESVIGKTDYELLPNEHGRMLLELKREVLETGISIYREIQIQATDGSMNYYDCKLEALRDATGRVIGVIGATTNITTLRRQMQATEENEKRYRALVEASPDAILMHEDGRLVYVNPTFEKLTGHTAEQMSGRLVFDYIAPDFHDKIRERINQLHQGTGPLPLLELQLLRPDGQRIDVEATSTPVALQGRLTALVMIRDVSQRKLIERQLVETVNRLEAHLANTQLAIVEFDADFTIIRWSTEAEKVFGWTADEVVGRKPSELRWVHVDDQPRVSQAAAALYDGSTPRVRCVNRNYRKDGSVVHVDWFNSAIYDDHGRLRTLLALGLDITDRVVSEYAARESAEQRRMALEAGNLGWWQYDPDTKEVTCDERAHEMFAVSAQRVLFEELLASVHPEDRALVGAAVSAALDPAAEPLDLEYRILHSDGSITWVELRGKAHATGPGRHHSIRLVGTVTDVSVRREADLRIREMASMPLENPNPVLRVDSEGTLLFANAPAHELLANIGWHEGEPVPEPITAAAKHVTQSSKQQTIELQGKRSTLYNVVIAPSGITGTVNVYTSDITDRREVERAARDRAAQQEAVASLGLYALSVPSLRELMDETVRVVSETLQVEFCKVLELLPDGNELLLRAGVGWHDGLVGHATVDAAASSQAGFTLRSKRPVIVTDLTRETRFSAPSLLSDHHVVSGMSVIIGELSSPYGVLGVHSQQRRTISPDDVNFLQAIANLLASAVERQRTQEAIDSARANAEKALTDLANQKYALDQHAIVAVTDRAGNITYANDKFCEISKYSRDELIGQNHRIINSGYHPKSFFENLWKTISSGDVWHGEICNRAKDGSLYWVDTTIVPFKDDRGHIREYVAIRADITARKRVEVALSESDDQLRAITDVTPALISYVDADLRYRFINRQYELWFDIPREEALGRTMHEVLGEAVMERLLPYAQRALAGEDLRFEVEAPYRSGTRWIDAHYLPRRDEAGTVIGFYVLVVDISERKRTERALEVSEKRFRLMANSAPVLIWMADGENRGTWFNQPWLEFVGRTLEQELGFGWTEHVHPDDAPRCIETCQTAFDRREEFRMEFRLKHHSGEYRWLLDHGIPLFDEKGEFTGYIGSCIDITDRKEAEEALLESSQQARAFGEAVDYGIWVCDPEGKCTYASQSFCDMLGKSLDEIIQFGWTDCLPPEDIPPMMERWLASVATGEPFEYEHRFRSKNGGTRIVLARGIAIRNATGRIVSWAGINLDITDRKLAEEALRESEARYRSLFENQPIGIGIGAPDGVTLSLNRSGLELHGFESESEMFTALEQYIEVFELRSLDGRILPIEEWPVSRAMRGEYVRDFEVYLRNVVRNYERVVSYSVSPVLNAHGDISFLVYSILDLTERRKAEGALRKSEARFRELANAMPQLVWTADPDGTVDYYNDQYKQYVGFSPREDGSYEWAPALHPDDVQPTIDAWRGAIESGSSYEIEHRVQATDGSYRWHLSRGIPMRDEHGRVAKWFGTATDIHDLKQAETALAENEERFRVLANSIPQLAWMADGSGSVLWYNERWYEYTGTSFEEMKGWGWKAVHHPDYIDRVTESWVQCINKGEVWEDTFPLCSADGQYRWFLTRAIPIKDESGRIYRWFGTNTEITEQFELMERLRDSEQRFRLALEASKVVVFAQDRDLRYTWIHNPSFGMKPSDVIGKTDLDVLPEESARVLMTLKRRVLATGEHVRQMVRINPGDGDYYFDLVVEPIRETDGAVSGIICSTFDLTDRIEQEKAIEESERRYRSLFELSPDGAFIQTGGVIRTVNDAFVELMGAVSADQLIGRSIWSFIHPDYHVAIKERIADQLSGGRIEPLEEIWIRLDGIQVTVEASASPLMWQNKPAIQMMLHDITERKRAEQALMESEQRYRDLVELSPDGVIIESEDRIVFANRAFANMVGALSPEHLIGRLRLDFVHPEFHGLAKERQRGLRLGEVESYALAQEQFLRLDGSPIDVEVANSRFTWRGQPAAQIIVRDISERLKSEQAVREADARLRAAVNSIPAAFVIYDPDRRVQYVNDFGLRSLGLTATQVLGRRSEEIDPAAASEVTPLLEQVIATGEQVSKEISHFRSTGSITVLASFVPLKDRDGKVTRVSAVYYDITERRRSEQALLENEAKLRRAAALAHLGNLEWDRESDMLFWSPELRRIFGLEETSAISATLFYDLIHPGDREQVRARFETSFEDRDPVDMEFRISRPDGAVRYLHAIAEVSPNNGASARIFATLLDITPFREAVLELAENEAKLAHASTLAQVGHWELDLVTHRLTVSGEITRMLHLPEDAEITLDTVIELLPPEERETGAHLVERLLRTHAPFDMEQRMIRFDGSEIIVHNIGEFVFNDSGRPIKWFGAIQDITERRRAEQAIRESEERFRAMADSAPVLIWIADDTAGSTYFNKVWFEFTGRTFEQESGYGWTEGIHPEDRDFCLDIYLTAFHARKPFEMEFRLRRDDGKFRWLLDRGRPRFLSDGTFLGYIGTCIDITERKQAENQLFESEQRLRQAVNNYPATFIVYDKERRVEFINRRVVELAGIPEEEIIGKRDEDLFTEDMYGTYLPWLTRAVETGQPQSGEAQIITPDGRESWVVASFVPVYDREGNLRQVLGITYDVTERKSAEMELKRAHDELEQRVFERTGELIEANKLLVREVEERTVAERALIETTKMLEEERAQLERKNIALKEIFDQIEAEKNQIKEQLATNIEQVIIPTLQKLPRATKASLPRLVDMLEKDFRQITSPFVDALKSNWGKLSPREIEICRLIKNGMSTKEIAETLNLSPMTVQKHREVIRKKLGLVNVETNLQTYLQNI